LLGRTTTGDILGTARDASGGVVTDARITVRNLETNQTKETTTSETGSFRVPGTLPLGISPDPAAKNSTTGNTRTCSQRGAVGKRELDVLVHAAHL